MKNGKITGVIGAVGLWGWGNEQEIGKSSVFFILECKGLFN